MDKVFLDSLIQQLQQMRARFDHDVPVVLFDKRDPDERDIPWFDVTQGEAEVVLEF